MGIGEAVLTEMGSGRAVLLSNAWQTDRLVDGQTDGSGLSVINARISPNLFSPPLAPAG